MPKGDYPVQDFIVKRITRMLQGPVFGLKNDLKDLVKKFNKPKKPKTYNVRAGGVIKKRRK